LRIDDPNESVRSCNYVLSDAVPNPLERDARIFVVRLYDAGPGQFLFPEIGMYGATHATPRNRQLKRV
jgi:hypothetical protein